MIEKRINCVQKSVLRSSPYICRNGNGSRKYGFLDLTPFKVMGIFHRGGDSRGTCANMELTVF